MAKRILGIGVPSAFENSLFEAGRIVVVSMISTFGTVQLAANAVANNLDGVGCIPGKAISLAMITVVGRCVGAGDNEQAVYYTKKLLGWAYLVMGILNGLILLFVRPLVGIYELSGETMELSIILACIHAGFADVILVALNGYMSYLSIIYISKSYTKMTPVLGISSVYISSSVLIAFVLMTMYSIKFVWQDVTGSGKEEK